MSELTHFDDSGASRMVDVSQKATTQRFARAETFVSMQASTGELIRNRDLAKGDVFEVARLAGIMAAKQTAGLIPLCHPLSIDSVTLDLEFTDEQVLHIQARVALAGRTGVEMEALTAVSVAALTVYDMCKAVDREMSIGPTRLVEKAGGKSGHFLRNPETKSDVQ